MCLISKMFRITIELEADVSFGFSGYIMTIQ